MIGAVPCLAGNSMCPLVSHQLHISFTSASRQLHRAPQQQALADLALSSIPLQCAAVLLSVLQFMMQDAVTPHCCRYMNQVDSQYPNCRTLEGGGNANMDEGTAVDQPSIHQKLLHRYSQLSALRFTSSASALAHDQIMSSTTPGLPKSSFCLLQLT